MERDASLEYNAPAPHKLTVRSTKSRNASLQGLSIFKYANGAYLGPVFIYINLHCTN